MDKDRFCKIINQLKASEEMCGRINEIIYEYSNVLCTDFVNGYTFDGFHSSIVVELLEEILGDKYETVSWWCWETNFGKGKDKFGVEPIITLDAGTEIRLNTPEELYDFLIQERDKNAI